MITVFMLCSDGACSSFFRFQTCFLLQPGHHRSHDEFTFCAAVVCAWTALDGEQPIDYGVAEHLLEIFERATKCEGVFSRKGLEDGEDMLFC